MTDKPYSLDTVSEYIEFIVGGKNYRLKHLTTEEQDELQTLQQENPIKAREFLYRFISPVNEADPQFSEVAKKMTTPQWIKFSQMLQSEYKS